VVSPTIDELREIRDEERLKKKYSKAQPKQALKTSDDLPSYPYCVACESLCLGLDSKPNICISCGGELYPTKLPMSYEDFRFEKSGPHQRKGKGSRVLLKDVQLAVGEESWIDDPPEKIPVKEFSTEGLSAEELPDDEIPF
jgi:hypothetical protein